MVGLENIMDKMIFHVHSHRCKHASGEPESE